MIGSVGGGDAGGLKKGGDLINKAAESFGNAIKKGVHPIVKNNAKKQSRKQVSTF